MSKCHSINLLCNFIEIALLLKLLNAIAESRQTDWRAERTKTCDSIFAKITLKFLQSLDIIKIMLLQMETLQLQKLLILIS